MDILFYYGRPIKQNDGGIASITLSLIHYLTYKGHKPYVLCKKGTIDKSCVGGQYILPSSDVAGVDNLSFVTDIIKLNAIDVVINQIPIDDESESLLIKVRNKCGVKIISCFHNPVTLSAKNIAYRKGYQLNKHHVPFIQSVIRSKFVNSLIVKSYISKNRSRYQRILDNSDVCVVLCEGMKLELEEMLGYSFTGVRSQQAAVIPNFLLKYPESITEKEELVVWCGHVDFDVKRIDVVLNFWKMFSKEFPSWKLAVLGDGPCMEEAKNICKDMGLKGVSFEGRVTPNEFYKRSSFTMVTSAYESFSLVTLESMSYGSVPVVFNTFPAASYIINNEKVGILVRPYDFNEAKMKMKSLIQSESKYKEYSNNAFIRSQAFSMNEIGKLWEDILSSVL